jgi:hypothetical protein
MYRIHKVVESIMDANSIQGNPAAIPPNKVLGFRNQTVLESFLFANPSSVQGSYTFASLSDRAITFVLQLNSTSLPKRGVWERPYLSVALPMQVAAHRAISRIVSPGRELDIGTQIFAHPAFDVSTFEGVVAPLFLLGCKNYFIA